jgi:hypothetical protein
MKKKPSVDREKVNKCLQQYMEEKVSIRQPAAPFDLPYTTVHRHLQACHTNILLPSVGRLPSLPTEAAVEIAAIARTAASHGFGLLKTELKRFIGDFVQSRCGSNTDVGAYLRANCRFKEQMPSDDYVTQFMHEHHLSLVIPSNIQRLRKEAISDPYLIYEFYNLLQNELSRLGLQNTPANIFNVDETSFNLDPRGVRIVTSKGQPAHRAIAGSGREWLTVMAAVNATGEHLSPMVIFKAKNLYSSWYGSKALPGTTYGVSRKFLDDHE